MGTHLIAFQRRFTLDWSDLALQTKHWCVCGSEAHFPVGFFCEIQPLHHSVKETKMRRLGAVRVFPTKTGSDLT